MCVFKLIVVVISHCINYVDTISLMCFINNYTAFVLSVIDMAFKGLHDADPLNPSVLVLQDIHRSHLVDTEQVCILLLIN